jgi:hypothetical protein
MTAAAENNQPNMLELWVQKGLGEYPLIETREQLEALPPGMQQEIAAQFPEHYEYLVADLTKLPAELRLRMQSDKPMLYFEDAEALESAGFVAAVQFLNRARQEHTQTALDAFIERQEAEMEAAATARDAEAAAAQQALQQRAQQHQRAAYVRHLHNQPAPVPVPVAQ